MRLFKPKTWWAAAATASILASVITASPSMADAASGTPQGFVAAAETCYTYHWYMQNAPTYGVGYQTINPNYVAVNLHGNGTIIWNFCRIGSAGGAPVFDLVVNKSIGSYHIGE